MTIVYISHRLEEVFELCDRVSVLRDGALVATRKVSETNEAELIALMINRTIEQIYHKEAAPIGATIIETDNLCGLGFRDVSITVREGEIVGLYGLIGAGRSEFVQSVFGRHPATSGRISWLRQGRLDPQRTQGDGSRHRAVARKPPRPGLVPASRRRRQHQSADLQASEHRPADQSARAKRRPRTGRSATSRSRRPRARRQ